MILKQPPPLQGTGGVVDYGRGRNVLKSWQGDQWGQAKRLIPSDSCLKSAVLSHATNEGWDRTLIQEIQKGKRCERKIQYLDFVLFTDVIFF